MSEHEQEPGAEERIDDLDVPENESAEVKGGLPAVQKVRDAANRTQLSKGGEIEVESFSWGSS